MSRFHNALYAGDVEGRIAILRDVGLCEWRSESDCHNLCDLHSQIH